MSAGARAASAAALLAAGVAAALFLPLGSWTLALVEWTRGVGPLGAVLLALAYVPACILFVPGSLLTLGAGFALGVPIGTVAVSAGSTAGAAAAFLLGRTLARDLIEARVSSDPRFLAIDRAVEREGFKIVLLTRLSPVFPFNLLNYAYGLTKVSFRDYLLASWIGMLPGTLMYVYLGSAIQTLAELSAGGPASGWGKKALFALGLAATVAATAFVTRVSARALREAVPDAGRG